MRRLCQWTSWHFATRTQSNIINIGTASFHNEELGVSYALHTPWLHAVCSFVQSVAEVYGTCKCMTNLQICALRGDEVEAVRRLGISNPAIGTHLRRHAHKNTDVHFVCVHVATQVSLSATRQALFHEKKQLLHCRKQSSGRRIPGGAATL